MTDAEPLEGITDAIYETQRFLDYARHHRDRPGNESYLNNVWDSRERVLRAFKALK